MQNGDTLLHGDYYPGSWMRVRERLYIIDPEFSFAGPKEFDLGINGSAPYFSIRAEFSF